jgi:flagellar basal-body rod modification protein FlgD
MSRIPSAGPIQDTGAVRSSGDLRDVNLDDFLQLMITELQNQDPLEPMDNAQIVQQMGQIREISATNQLIETLDAMVTGQNLGTASAMIGKKISALTDGGDAVNGVVDRVTVETDDEQNVRTYRLHVGSQQVKLTSVREVQSD